MLLPPLPYHVAVCEHLKTYESGLWQWFKSDDFSGEEAEASKLELLKSCYRMTPESHAELYAGARQVAGRLAINCPLTLYQLQASSIEPNAALYYFEDELCVVLSGPIAELLNQDELNAVFAHEFSHHKLYTDNNGDFFAAARLLRWCSQQPDCHDAYAETARRYDLHTELYADQGAAAACGGVDAPIASLVKVNTGLKNVTVEDYLAQAREILEQDSTGAKGYTHPETYIRAQALAAAPDNPEQYLALVRGKLDALSLDILDQRELASCTRAMAQLLGTDSRFRDDAHQMVLREYFPSFDWAAESPEAEQNAQTAKLAAQLQGYTESTLKYFSYVLLDLTTADRDDSYPLLGATMAFARELEMLTTFEPLARKDLKLKKADTTAALVAEDAA